MKSASARDKDSILPLIEYAATFESRNVPEAVLKHTADLFTDTMGCILAGSSARGINELRETLAFWGGSGHATVFSFGEKTSPLSAALINSAMGHANDFDDTHDDAVNHGCVTLVPALLATCEVLKPPESFGKPSWVRSRKISGREFIAALAIGLDISNRLGMAFIRHLHVGWLPTTLWGPFACAGACGRLLKLDRDSMSNAFGLAYSQIHANRQGLVDGVLAKRIQPGFSSSAGVQSAFLAAGGITGAKNIVDGQFGLRELYANGQCDPTHLLDRIGLDFETANVSVKPYPCCRCSHPVIDAALHLSAKHGFKWQDIESGTIFLPPQSMGQIGHTFVIRDNPTVDAQFSAQYTAALAFTKGWPKIDDFEKIKILERKDVIGLAKRFSVEEFEMDAASVVPVEMEIVLKNGSSFQTRIAETKGSPGNPLTEEELNFKFRDCLFQSAKSFSSADCDRILSCLNKILEFDDITDVIELF
ncbi:MULTISPECIES: MmgE/PrpD family protein [Roseovarius]|jgi:2-methylcitrate dehydratase PrpD|uniref:MmgE/PrpD family protein n=1 Tax=Roseovarius TaxID=74030 RepID=UPI000CDE2A92|nr:MULTISPECIES: MmgE/PrpD family protein [Roseovarius]